MSEYKPRKRWCPECDGRGKIRNNIIAHNLYVFGFMRCGKCDGAGVLFSKQRIKPSSPDL